MAGSEMVYQATKVIKAAVKELGSQLTLMLGTELVGLRTSESGTITGAELALPRAAGKPSRRQLDDPRATAVIATPNVVLATGGFCSDVGDGSLLAEYRSDLMGLASTNGEFATGDGHKHALAVGAGLIDIDKVQVHPTAFIRNGSGDGDRGRLTLAAELLRGVGAVLLDQTGHRFANELGKRDYLSARIKEADPNDVGVTLLLNAAGAKIANKHVPHYTKKGLLVEFSNLTAIAEHIGVSVVVLRATLKDYAAAAATGSDHFGKEHFHNPTFDDDSGPFFVGKVKPALHYSIGGLRIDVGGHVLRKNGEKIPGLFAAGEVTGGVHGENRLGGQALTEAVVFGQQVGNGIKLGNFPRDVKTDYFQRLSQHLLGPKGVAAFGEFALNSEAATRITEDAISSGQGSSNSFVETSQADMAIEKKSAASSANRQISTAELRAHASDVDCWVAIYGDIYDFTDFVPEHPGGVETVTDVCGEDGTDVFDAVHTRGMLDDFEPIGRFVV